MGLNASVYRDDEDAEQIASVHLGNSAMIGHLHETISKELPSASVLLTKVLYSGTHCGDSLGIQDLQKAQLELQDLGAKLASDSDVRHFVVTFGGLIEIALRHGRPVTF